MPTPPPDAGLNRPGAVTGHLYQEVNPHSRGVILYPSIFSRETALPPSFPVSLYITILVSLDGNSAQEVVRKRLRRGILMAEQMCPVLYRVGVRVLMTKGSVAVLPLLRTVYRAFAVIVFSSLPVLR